MIFLLTGESGSGKTNLLTELAVNFRIHNIKTGGFTAPGTWLNGIRSGFMLHDLFHNTEYPLAKTGGSGPEMQGRFVFEEKTFEFGNQLLMKQLAEPALDIIIVDEVGPYEVRGKGWASSLDLLATSEKPQIWAVRHQLVDQVTERWNFEPVILFLVKEVTPEQVFSKIDGICFHTRNE
ncbi:MAG: nucleoside-triphosphatase [Lentimicrobium sp.]